MRDGSVLWIYKGEGIVGFLDVLGDLEFIRGFVFR